jgi:hypothetical protein
VQHLTSVSRENIPYFLTQVSQQEKLEGFVSNIEEHFQQMKW